MKQYKGMLPDRFFEVEANSEAEAQMKMVARLRDDIEDDDFIVWEAGNEAAEAQARGGCP